jgi:hypothetical protein
MYSQKDLQMLKEHRKQLLREAQNQRLARSAQPGRQQHSNRQARSLLTRVWSLFL